MPFLPKFRLNRFTPGSIDNRETGEYDPLVDAYLKIERLEKSLTVALEENARLKRQVSCLHERVYCQGDRDPCFEGGEGI